MTARASGPAAPVIPAAGFPGKKPGFAYRRSGIWAIRVVVFVALIAAWEWYAQGVSRALFAPPSEVAQAFYDLAIAEPRIWGALGESLLALAVGLALCIVVGVPVGLAMGRSKTLEFVLDPYVTFLYVLPNVAFIPLLVVWVGYAFELRIALVFLSGVFPMIINTIAGVKHVDPELIDGGRSFNASEAQIIRTIIFPGSLPFVFAGLRIAFSSAWVGVIVAEMTALLAGIGGMIAKAADRFRTAEVFVPILFIMAVGVSVQWFTSWLQRRMTPWEEPVEGVR